MQAAQHKKSYVYCASDQSAARYITARTVDEELRRCAAAAGAILTADFFGREFIWKERIGNERILYCRKHKEPAYLCGEADLDYAFDRGGAFCRADRGLFYD